MLEISQILVKLIIYITTTILRIKKSLNLTMVLKKALTILSVAAAHRLGGDDSSKLESSSDQIDKKIDLA